MIRNIQQHLRDTFLAGIFAGVPIVVTVIIINWIDAKTSGLWPFPGEPVPFVGIALAILCLYLIGLIVRSLIGRQLLAFVDSVILRMPVIGAAYKAWKQVSLTPGGKEGMFAKVVLVRIETGKIQTVGFTNGETIPGSKDICAVFIPNSPNPITGRLFFVPRSDLVFLDISTEEGLKLVVSAGNYIPQRVGGML